MIDPANGDIGADREHTIILSDWTFSDPHEVMRKLKVAEGYYNYQKRTIFDTLEDVKKKGLPIHGKSVLCGVQCIEPSRYS